MALGVGAPAMNAVLPPVALGFLYLLARRVLAWPYRLQRAGTVVAITIAPTAGLGLYAGVAGLRG